MAQRYSDGHKVGTYAEWVRTLGSTSAFDVAFTNGHIDEVHEADPATLDAPPFM